jgi:hypothetical protein
MIKNMPMFGQKVKHKKVDLSKGQGQLAHPKKKKVDLDLT